MLKNNLFKKNSLFKKKVQTSQINNSINLSTLKKTIGFLRKLQNLSSWSSLLATHKAFVRPHLDCGAIIYDEAYNASFHQKHEKFEYNACLAMTGAIRALPRIRLGVPSTSSLI